jgi:hypothetical protein
MSNFFVKSVFFHGDKGRIKRFVERENGKMLADQRFWVIIKNNRVKWRSQNTFCFVCRYYKVEGGYQIRYIPLLSVFSLLQLIVLLVVIGWVVYERQLNPYITYGVAALLYSPNYFIQRSRCIRQFEAACQK